MRHIRLPLLLASLALVAVGCSKSQAHRGQPSDLGGGMIAADSFGTSMAMRNTAVRAQLKQQDQTSTLTSVPDEKQ